MRRFRLENQTFGKYHVVKYHEWSSNEVAKPGCYYDCVDMVTGRKKIVRYDILLKIDQRFRKQLEAITRYKKKNNLA